MADLIEILHIVLQIDNYFWDIKGAGTLEKKEEYISIVGKKEWNKTTDSEILKTINNPNEVLDVYKKLKDIYIEKQGE